MAGESDQVSVAQKNFKMLVGPIVAYTVLAAGYLAYLPGKWIWFSWHPIAMIVAFIGLASNSFLIKKIGGYANTKTHAALMFIAIAVALFGWYVIYTNKNMYGKPHLVTPHGKLGALVCVGYLLLGVGGAVALNPDFGIMKTNKTVRACHKWGGRILTVLSWLCCVFGEFSSFLLILLYFY